MTPEQRWARMARKARLLDELCLLTVTIQFYGWGRIFGLIPETPRSVSVGLGAGGPGLDCPEPRDDTRREAP